MKKISKYILEKLRISNSTLFPKTKNDLQYMIINEIKKFGKKCSLNHIDVSEIQDMSKLFYIWNDDPTAPETKILQSFNGDISGWDVSNVTNMSWMFAQCKFTGENGDISKWNTENVEYLRCAFWKSKYNGDISLWNTSKVKNMYATFSVAKDFNCDISDWNVSNVLDFGEMFSFSNFNQPLEKWNVTKKYVNKSRMFFKCPLQNNPPSWY